MSVNEAITERIREQDERARERKERGSWWKGVGGGDEFSRGFSMAFVDSVGGDTLGGVEMGEAVWMGFVCVCLLRR